jgi:hypothetical protein
VHECVDVLGECADARRVYDFGLGARDVVVVVESRRTERGGPWEGKMALDFVLLVAFVLVLVRVVFLDDEKVLHSLLCESACVIGPSRAYPLAPGREGSPCCASSRALWPLWSVLDSFNQGRDARLDRWFAPCPCFWALMFVKELNVSSGVVWVHGSSVGKYGRRLSGVRRSISSHFAPNMGQRRSQLGCPSTPHETQKRPGELQLFAAVAASIVGGGAGCHNMTPMLAFHASNWLFFALRDI